MLSTCEFFVPIYLFSVRNHDEVNVKRVGAEQTSIGSLMGNDDEDSGFTSYHSRRPLSPLQQDVNSTLTDSCTSNELYRSGRTAEDSMHDSISESSYPDGYLGSADKYPNPTYGGSGHHLPPPVHHSPNVFQQTMSPGQPVSKQHLYANAPPKPKRMGGPGDIYALGIHDGETVSSRPAPGQGQHYSDYKERDKVTSQMSQHVASRGHRDSSPMPRLRVDEYQGPVSSQRRTPDPYARTAVNQGFEYQAPPVVGRHERNSNYTDEYAATIAAVAGQMHLQGGRDEYGSLQRQVVDFPHRSQKGSLQAAVAQRPHSAEFLDYNVYGDGSHQRRQRNPSEMVTQGRPRSTMIERYGPTDFDVNGINEMEMYASVHGRWPPPQVGGGKKTQRVQEITNERRSGSISTPCEGPATPRSNTSHNMSFDSYLTRDAVYGDVRDAQVQQSHLEPRPHSRPMPGQVERLSASPSSSVTGLDSITRNMNATNVVSPLARGEPSRTLPRDRSFMRSASARLPSATSMTSVNQLQVNGTGTKEDSRWKAQQREESMKRLLEWKQRMLQSPLTKKYQKSPGIPVQHQQSKTVPSSVTTSPVILPNSQNQDQHSPSSGTQQQSSGVHQPEDKMSSSRLSSSQHYQPQVKYFIST